MIEYDERRMIFELKAKRLQYDLTWVGNKYKSELTNAIWMFFNDGIDLGATHTPERQAA